MADNIKPMDITPSIEALKEQIKQLEKIVSDLEYQQLLNRAILNAHKTKEDGNNNPSKADKA